MKQHITEAAFETLIEAVLLANGYTRHASKESDAEQAIFPEIALEFIRATQSKIWETKDGCLPEFSFSIASVARQYLQS